MNSEYEWICSECKKPLPERGETFAFCPYCGASVAEEVDGGEGSTAVADMAARLRAPDRIDGSDALEVLTRVPSEAEASMIVQCLTSQEIAAHAVGGYTAGFAAQAPGDVSILVKCGDLARAASALAAVQQEDPAREATDEERDGPARRAESRKNEDVAFACQECGKTITLAGDRRGHVEMCPHCAGYVDVPDETEGSPLPESGTAVSQGTLGSVESEQPTGIDSNSRTDSRLWIEVLAILCLAYFPPMFGAVAYLLHPTKIPFLSNELSLIVRSLQVSLPVLMIMALSKDPWSLFGIVRPKWIADVLGGFAIWIVAFVVHFYAVSLLPPWMRGSGHHLAGPKGMPTYCLLLAGSVANGFAEEVVMRGYLLPRLERLLRSTWLAVLITTALFASYHIYQGVRGAVGAAAIGFVYAVVFCLSRRLWPLCVAHAIADFMPYL